MAFARHIFSQELCCARCSEVSKARCPFHGSWNCPVWELAQVSLFQGSTVTSPKARLVPFNLQPHCSPYFPLISYHLLSLALITAVLGSFECLSHAPNYKLHKEPSMPSWTSQCRTDAPQCFVLWWIAKEESIPKQTITLRTKVWAE